MYSIHSCNLNIPEKEKISLYFKSNEDIFQKDKGILIKNPSVIDFGTLFSSFSIGKWIKFTNLKSIFIEIYSKGEIELELFYKKSSESNSEILNKFKFNGSFSEEIQFPKDSLQESIIWFKIITLEKDVTIESISYKSPILPLNKIKLGIVFTTYNREEYIKNNISKTSIIPDQIKEDLTIIVVDNAKTLNKEDFNNIHLIPNKNMGGAGGFTRGMMFALEKGCTHILFMDDDVEFEFTSIEKLYNFLGYLKEEYKFHFIGSGMIKKEEPTIQYELTANWKNSHLKLINQNFNLEEIANFQKNEALNIKPNYYSGWWFTCISKQTVEKIGFPFPFFIKGDDLEYSLRNNSKIIYLNGLQIWHESFEKKHSDWVYFYWIRNSLILTSRMKFNFTLFHILTFLLGKFLIYKFFKSKEILYYFQLGFQNFLEGKESFFSKDPEELHNQIRNPKDKFKHPTLTFFKSIFTLIKNKNKIINNFRNIEKEEWRNFWNKNFN